jgi:hypothetical protein
MWNELLPEERAVGIEKEWKDDMGFQNDNFLSEHSEDIE